MEGDQANFEEGLARDDDKIVRVR